MMLRMRVLVLASDFPIADPSPCPGSSGHRWLEAPRNRGWWWRNLHRWSTAEARHRETRRLRTTGCSRTRRAARRRRPCCRPAHAPAGWRAASLRRQRAQRDRSRSPRAVRRPARRPRGSRPPRHRSRRTHSCRCRPERQRPALGTVVGRPGSRRALDPGRPAAGRSGLHCR